MNFLELAQRLRLECSGTGTGPTSVSTPQNNEYARFINWINDAYIEILGEHLWKFRQVTFDLACTPGTGDYTEANIVAAAGLAASQGISRYDVTRFRYWPAGATVASEQFAYYQSDYRLFDDQFRFGPNRTSPGVPQYVTATPARGIKVWPIPDAAHHVTGMFWKAPRRMAADGDSPIFPEEFHMLPVWWAMVKYAGFEETSVKYVHAQNMMSIIKGDLEAQELDPITLGAPLA